MNDYILVNLFFTDGDKMLGMTSEMLVTLAKNLQSKTLIPNITPELGIVTIQYSEGEQIIQRNVVGFMVYGKKAHDYPRVIMFDKKSKDLEE